MSDFGTTYPDVPVIGGSDDRLVENDLLPWNHFICAANKLDVYNGVGTGQQQFPSDSWIHSWFSYTTVQTTGEMGWYVNVAAGTWAIMWAMSRRSDYGISRARVDGADVGVNVDLYSATVEGWYAYVTQGVVLTRGEHLFTIKQTGLKNASATAYTQVMCALSLARTA